GYQSVIWNQLMAASIVGIVPVLLIFLFLQRYLVEGLTKGALKG
ncbi:MAG: carbohydrate ABC transporter permease, partial [SAR324 cluster bacterium]|nr:carbohydrate ABC transporter permease [SAR324 cluster bacterium]